MKKLFIPVVIIILSLSCGFGIFSMFWITKNVSAFASTDMPIIITPSPATPVPTQKENASTPKTTGKYEVYVNNKLFESFHEFEAAVAFAENHAKSSVKEKGKTKWLWDNYPPYNVFKGFEEYAEYETFAEAVKYAKLLDRSFIYYRKDHSLIWTNTEKLSNSAYIDAPVINQMPELPRGCEVTSLAMLLNHRDIKVDKMTLAEQIKKDTTPFETKNGIRYAGNPNNGFVGSMYDMSEDGLGVYHAPIYELLTEYLPKSSLDLTGCDFSDLYYFLEKGVPVWIITNSYFSKLPASEFRAWRTPDGDIQITYREHSVLVTGYDGQYVYFNDPYTEYTRKSDKQSFIEAWEQMGRQAVTYTP